MQKITLTQIERQYKIDGQHKEQCFRYTLTGKIMKADNVQGADLWDIQIKSARATVCKGTDFATFIINDIANQYAYVSNEYVAYIMSKQEYIAMVEMFGCTDTDSKKNGGHTKTRLKHESKAMIEWLEGHTL
jgi:hypothetical protein